MERKNTETLRDPQEKHQHEELKDPSFSREMKQNCFQSWQEQEVDHFRPFCLIINLKWWWLGSLASREPEALRRNHKQKRKKEWSEAAGKNAAKLCWAWSLTPIMLGCWVKFLLTSTCSGSFWSLFSAGCSQPLPEGWRHPTVHFSSFLMQQQPQRSLLLFLGHFSSAAHSNPSRALSPPSLCLGSPSVSCSVQMQNFVSEFGRFCLSVSSMMHEC